MEVTATELRNRFGNYQDIPRRGLVIVDKSGRETALLIFERDLDSARLNQVPV